MSKHLNTVVKFENPFGYEILEGTVTKDTGYVLTVQILHGEHHGDFWEVPVCDVIEDYGYSEETEEKFVKWYSDE